MATMTTSGWLAQSRRLADLRTIRDRLLAGLAQLNGTGSAPWCTIAASVARAGKRNRRRRTAAIVAIGAVLNASVVTPVALADGPAAAVVSEPAEIAATTFSLEDLANIEVVPGVKVGDLRDYAPLALRLLRSGLSRHALLKALLDEVTAEMARREAKAEKAESTRRHVELVTLIRRLDDALADEAAYLARKLSELKADNEELKRELADARASLKRVEAFITELRNKGVWVPETRGAASPPFGGWHQAHERIGRETIRRHVPTAAATPTPAPVLRQDRAAVDLRSTFQVPLFPGSDPTRKSAPTDPNAVFSEAP